MGLLILERPLVSYSPPPNHGVGHQRPFKQVFQDLGCEWAARIIEEKDHQEQSARIDRRESRISTGSEGPEVHPTAVWDARRRRLRFLEWVSDPRERQRGSPPRADQKTGGGVVEGDRGFPNVVPRTGTLHQGMACLSIPDSLVQQISQRSWTSAWANPWVLPLPRSPEAPNQQRPSPT
ncbi:hypothetical protein LX36DRAFT_663602 [Colletotrichum falcatum]|nr:hypothetical protein LX36DRAFT_663602 [Colletotrichum falcatum]